MTIHHAIVKSAATKGVVLSQEDTTITAHHMAANVRVNLDSEYEDGEGGDNDVAREAMGIALDIVAFNEDTANAGWVARGNGQEDGEFTIAKVGAEGAFFAGETWEDVHQEYAEAKDAGFPDHGGEGSEEGDDEEDLRGSIVPHTFKARYKAAGHPANCGDWLREKLDEVCIRTSQDGVDYTDQDILDQIAQVNNTPTAKYPHGGNRGWQGRRAMTIRNVMARKVAAAGFLLIPESVSGKGDKEHKAPAAFIAKYGPKPKAAKAK